MAAKMKFMMFTWDHNPEEFRIEAYCQPEYTVNELGVYEYVGLGPMCRVISGRGVFSGPDANQNFNALAVIMAMRKPGELVMPVWGTIQACLTELKLEHGSRPEHVVYSFVFRETDDIGGIPRLPEIDERK